MSKIRYTVNCVLDLGDLGRLSGEGETADKKVAEALSAAALAYPHFVTVQEGEKDDAPHAKSEDTHAKSRK